MFQIRETGKHERTAWGFVCCLVVIGLLAASLAVPWWTYKFSTGPRAPPGGPQTTNETFEERERLDFYPYRTEGGSNNTTTSDVERVTRTLGHLVAAPLVILALIAIAEVPLPLAISTRWFTLIVTPIAFLLTLAGLIYAWFAIPPLLDSAGVDKVFTTRPLEGGFVQTWLFWGWTGAGAALLIQPAIFAFKFQAGATDPTVIESYKRAVIRRG